MFRITIGSIEWWFQAFPDSASGDLAGLGSLLFFISYVVRRFTFETRLEFLVGLICEGCLSVQSNSFIAVDL